MLSSSLYSWIAAARYASNEALDQVGHAFEAAGTILADFMAIYIEEVALPAIREDPAMDDDAAEETSAGQRGIARLEAGVLRKRIAAPLGALYLQ